MEDMTVFNGEGVEFGSVRDILGGKTFDSEYFYNTGLTDGITNILDKNAFTYEDKEMLDCIYYFNSRRGFVMRLVKERLTPFKDIKLANNFLRGEAKRLHSTVTNENVHLLNIGEFASSYLRNTVRNDLLEVYQEIRNCATKLEENFLAKLK